MPDPLRLHVLPARPRDPPVHSLRFVGKSSVCPSGPKGEVQLEKDRHIELKSLEVGKVTGLPRCLYHGWIAPPALLLTLTCPRRGPTGHFLSREGLGGAYLQ